LSAALGFVFLVVYVCAAALCRAWLHTASAALLGGSRCVTRTKTFAELAVERKTPQDLRKLGRRWARASSSPDGSSGVQLRVLRRLGPLRQETGTRRFTTENLHQELNDCAPALMRRVLSARRMPLRETVARRRRPQARAPMIGWRMVADGGRMVGGWWRMVGGWLADGGGWLADGVRAGQRRCSRDGDGRDASNRR
jgi:hypothetical protein